MPTQPRCIVLRGYIKEAGPGLYVGVCLTLNLVVQAPSQSDALSKLGSLIGAYLEDAVENNEFEQFVPRRAPLHFYVEYWCARLVSMLRMLHRGFFVFKENRLIPAHA